MENCMEAKALKPSLRRELAQQVFLEDYLSLNGNNGVSISEDFSVDYFLDFSHEKTEDELYISNEQEEEEEEEEKDSLSVSSQDPENDDNISNSSTLTSDSLLASELSVPVDELKELEWVSHFVDDSLLENSLLYPKTETYVKNWSEPEPKPVWARGPCFSLPVPAKARTKRPRTTTGRVWSLGSPSLTESSSSSSSSSSSTGLSSTSCFIFTNTVQSMGLYNTCSEPPIKKSKKKSAVQTGELLGGSPFQRRCSHCLVQKTPQWRTGPHGAKTLCNACGVRYKSGRLFPEYRPACSPTFSSDIHSNSHRKVLEIRKKKEPVAPESELTQMVQSF